MREMTINRGIILALVVTSVVAMALLPCFAEKKNEEEKKDIWSEGKPRGPRPGPRPGLRAGPRPGLGRFELTDEEVDRILSSLKQSDPEKAKELTKLRKKDPEKFKIELRKYAPEEYGKIIRERMETWRRRRQTEFVEWLEKNYLKQAKELATLKGQQPDLYWKKFDLVRGKYWRIFEEDRRNPELAEVLKEDLELKERRDELLRRLKAAKSESQKKKLAAQLEEIVGRRYDLIVRKKEIAYERLLRWLEGLRKRVKESRGEIAKSKDEEVKAENVKNRLKDLTEGIPKFAWD